MIKPKCQECGKTDKVVKAFYGRDNEVWEEDWECERCNCVVEVVKDYTIGTKQAKSVMIKKLYQY